MDSPGDAEQKIDDLLLLKRLHHGTETYIIWDITYDADGAATYHVTPDPLPELERHRSGSGS